jgi:hypothetical protein
MAAIGIGIAEGTSVAWGKRDEAGPKRTSSHMLSSNMGGDSLTEHGIN